jgi:hypothetical protein
MTFIRKKTVDGGVSVVPAWIVKTYDKHSNEFITEFAVPSYEKAIEESLWIEKCVCDYRTEIVSPDGDVEDV